MNVIFVLFFAIILCKKETNALVGPRQGKVFPLNSILRMSTTEDVEKKAPESVGDVAREIIEKQFKIGKRIEWGIFQADVSEDDIPDANTRTALREIASRDLVNIDDMERARRTTVGKVSGMVAALSYFGALYFGFDIFLRTAITYFPLALSLGFLESGKQGL